MIKIKKNNNDKLNNVNLVNIYLVFIISDFIDENGYKWINRWIIIIIMIDRINIYV